MVVANEDVQSSPWVEPDNRISVSFKVHDGYSSPLINFSGSNPEQIKQDIAIVTGVEVEDIDRETVFSLLTKAHEQALQVYQASDILGATVGQQKKWGNGGGGNWSKPKPADQQSVGRVEKPADPDEALLEEINNAQSQGEVLRIFGRPGVSTGDFKVNGGWKTEALEAAAKAKFAEFKQKQEG